MPTGLSSRRIHDLQPEYADYPESQAPDEVITAYRFVARHAQYSSRADTHPIRRAQTHTRFVARGHTPDRRLARRISVAMELAIPFLTALFLFGFQNELPLHVGVDAANIVNRDFAPFFASECFEDLLIKLVRRTFAGLDRVSFEDRFAVVFAVLRLGAGGIVHFRVLVD